MGSDTSLQFPAGRGQQRTALRGLAEAKSVTSTLCQGAACAVPLRSRHSPVSPVSPWLLPQCLCCWARTWTLAVRDTRGLLATFLPRSLPASPRSLLSFPSPGLSPHAALLSSCQACSLSAGSALGQLPLCTRGWALCSRGSSPSPAGAAPLLLLSYRFQLGLPV